ncbi:MAG: hypothetical protein E7658_01635 [Ruminococcaceae bacterium]|nr:hypothetical protein [Oscillospiraceae bacterium]
MKGRTSVLTHPLPDAVFVDGVRIPIRTDYRTGILFGELAKDEDLDDLSRMKLGLWLYCGDRLPDVDLHRLFDALLAFYRGEMSPDTVENAPSSGNAPKGGVFDFVWDGDLIYGAFLQVYRMDLTQCELHWWKFLALLTALPPDCPFMRTAALRCMDISGIKDEETRRKLRRAKASVRIRNTKKTNKETEESIWQTDR